MSHPLRSHWKPNAKDVDTSADRALRAWMRAQGLDSGPGAVTLLLHSPVHESARDHAWKHFTAQAKTPGGRKP